MHKRDSRSLAAGVAIALAAASVHGDPMGTVFTYQGQLRDGAVPVNDTCAFIFTLWDAPTGGNPVGALTFDGIPPNEFPLPVVDGLFSVKLDFGGGVFGGDALWLEIEVKGSSDPDYVILTPRQEMTPAPYALALPGLWTEQDATSPNLIGGFSGNSTTNGVVGATIGGGGDAGSPNRVTGAYGTVGGGGENFVGIGHTPFDHAYGTVSGGYRNYASGSYVTVGGGRNNAVYGRDYATISGGRTNTADAAYATIGGGYLNIASYGGATVSGGTENQAFGYHATVGGGIRNNADSNGTVAGGEDNDATGYGATVSGGIWNDATAVYGVIGGGGGNLTDGMYTTIGGGVGNWAGGTYATIGGGSSNLTGSESPTIGGGRANTANSDYATVGGGSANLNSGNYATISGGRTNTADAAYATIGGGYLNIASYGGATVSGGTENQAFGYHATVGGGIRNNADSNGTVAGGEDNDATGYGATVSGGIGNAATGGFATVPGGQANVAGGWYSFAAGRRAKSLHDGAFVWADHTLEDFSSTAANQFLIRAAGGVGINTNGPQAALHVAGDVEARGVIESSTGGFRFPDGTLQTTALTGAGHDHDDRYYLKSHVDALEARIAQLEALLTDEITGVFPPPATNPSGTSHELVTAVVRASDGSPVEGYIVTYEVLDGLPAVFQPGGASVASVETDFFGLARVTLEQVFPAQGTNNIEIRISDHLEGYVVTYEMLDGPPAVFQPGGTTAVAVETDVFGLAQVTLEQVTPVEGTNNIEIQILGPCGRLAVGYSSKTWIGPGSATVKDAPGQMPMGETHSSSISHFDSARASTASQSSGRGSIQWEFPPPATNPVGTTHEFVTQVTTVPIAPGNTSCTWID